MTKNQVEEGVKHCFQKSCILTDACEVLLKDNHNGAVIVGLVTFALEEFGKGLLMKDRLKKSSSNYGIPKYIFGKTKHATNSHYDKIKRALQELPEDSRRFYPSILINFNNDPNVKVVTVGPKTTITIPPYLTGLFSSLDDDIVSTSDDDERNLTDSLADFTARMLCFYVDWDDAGKRWKKGIPTSEKSLKNLVSQLKEKISTFHECEL